MKFLVKAACESCSLTVRGSVCGDFLVVGRYCVTLLREAHSSEIPIECAGRVERRPRRWILTTGSKENKAPPLRPRGPEFLQAATGPSTDESSNGHGKRKDPAQ